MNKNGFIATSLIYTFFIMFIALFFSIIAEYIQNKVLLDTTEKSIKDELNSIITIKDLEVGSSISFVSDCANIGDEPIYIVAKVDYINSDIILYSYNLDGTASNHLTYKNIKSDFDNGGYNNETYYNKILYTFSGSDSSMLVDISDESGNKALSKVVDTTCSNEYKTSSGCIKNITGTKYRERKIIEDFTTKNKCIIDNSVQDGTIYIKE